MHGRLLVDLFPVADIADLLAAVRSRRELPREGEVEAFDAWRIRRFLDEAADDGHSDEDIDAACFHLAREGYLREVVESLSGMPCAGWTIQARRYLVCQSNVVQRWLGRPASRR
ncbi:hypothetical protein [Micromonospora sp. NPDC023814]